MGTMKNGFVVAIALISSVWLASAAQAQVVAVAGSNTDSYFGSQNDGVQVSNPPGQNPWPAAGPNPGPFYGTVNQLPGVPSPPTGSVAPSNVSPFYPFNGTSFYNDGFGNTAVSAISAFIAGSSGTADDAQIGLFMTLTQSAGGYAYEQVNYDVDFNVSSLVNTTGTAGTIAGLVSRSYAVSGTVSNSSSAFVAFGGEMSFWDGTTNTLLGAPLLFNYFSNTPGAFTATVSGSSVINAVNFPNVLRITGDFFLIGDPSTISVNSVPEPSTIALAALGLCGALVHAARKRFRVRS
ncbi:MAG TPA: PEP-CTERM sorting domain-containing protein [Pirellulales bacterium]|jgi:hypothetical protein